MLRFGRRRPVPAMPFSGRYLTRLIILMGSCVVAMVALNWPQLARFPAAGDSASEAARLLHTAIVPSPFGELGTGVFIASDAPQTKPKALTSGAIVFESTTSQHDGSPVNRELLEGVLDKTRELPPRAYYHLATLAAETPADLLEDQARRDITFAHLWSEPDQHRGELVYLKGCVRAIRKFEVGNEALNSARIESLYQADLFTDESRPNAYVIIVPDIAEGMPIGSNLAENISFAGYFFKLWRYTAGDRMERAAPLLIGRIISWTPAPHVERLSTFSMYLAIGLVIVIAGLGGAIWALNRGSVRQRAGAGRIGAEEDAATLAGLARLEEQEGTGPLNTLQEQPPDIGRHSPPHNP